MQSFKKLPAHSGAGLLQCHKEEMFLFSRQSMPSRVPFVD
jgi:hypothetical protein